MTIVGIVREKWNCSYLKWCFTLHQVKRVSQKINCGKLLASTHWNWKKR